MYWASEVMGMATVYQPVQAEHESCPYCGSKMLTLDPVRQERDRFSNDRFWTCAHVFCCECYARGPQKDTDEEAWDAWDRRVTNK